jgi:hypothetical protein
MAVGEPITGGTAGAVLYQSGSQSLAQDASHLFFDQTSKKLGVGTNLPSGVMHAKLSASTPGGTAGIVAQNIDSTYQVIVVQPSDFGAQIATPTLFTTINYEGQGIGLQVSENSTNNLVNLVSTNTGDAVVHVTDDTGSQVDLANSGAGFAARFLAPSSVTAAAFSDYNSLDNVAICTGSLCVGFSNGYYISGVIGSAAYAGSFNNAETGANATFCDSTNAATITGSMAVSSLSTPYCLVVGGSILSQVADTGSSGDVLTSNGSGLLPTWMPGVQGSQGATGSQGAAGSQGSQGHQGFQGATGSQGSQGFQGSQGSQGNQGATGSQGFQGNQGSQGPTSSATPTWVKYTVPYTSFTASANNQTVILDTLATNSVITGGFVNVNTNFTGGGHTDATAFLQMNSVSITSGIDAYGSSSGNITKTSSNPSPSLTGTVPLQVELASTSGNVNTFTSGQIDVWILIATLP